MPIDNEGNPIENQVESGTEKTQKEKPKPLGEHTPVETLAVSDFLRNMNTQNKMMGPDTAIQQSFAMGLQKLFPENTNIFSTALEELNNNNNYKKRNIELDPKYTAKGIENTIITKAGLDKKSMTPTQVAYIEALAEAVIQATLDKYYLLEDYPQPPDSSDIYYGNKDYLVNGSAMSAQRVYGNKNIPEKYRYDPNHPETKYTNVVPLALAEWDPYKQAQFVKDNAPNNKDAILEVVQKGQEAILERLPKKIAYVFDQVFQNGPLDTDKLNHLSNVLAEVLPGTAEEHKKLWGNVFTTIEQGMGEKLQEELINEVKEQIDANIDIFLPERFSTQGSTIIEGIVNNLREKIKNKAPLLNEEIKKQIPENIDLSDSFILQLAIAGVTGPTLRDMFEQPDPLEKKGLFKHLDIFIEIPKGADIFDPKIQEQLQNNLTQKLLEKINNWGSPLKHSNNIKALSEEFAKYFLDQKKLRSLANFDPGTVYNELLKKAESSSNKGEKNKRKPTKEPPKRGWSLFKRNQPKTRERKSIPRFFTPNDIDIYLKTNSKDIPDKNHQKAFRTALTKTLEKYGGNTPDKRKFMNRIIKEKMRKNKNT